LTVRRVSRLSLEELAPYLCQVPDPPIPLDWSALFANDHPVEIEIGFGQRIVPIDLAQANPAVNYLGVEIERKHQLFTANRIAKRNLRNVRLAKADGRLFLRDFVIADSVQAVHVYFPDPWWKQRHESGVFSRQSLPINVFAYSSPGAIYIWQPMWKSTFMS